MREAIIVMRRYRGGGALLMREAIIVMREAIVLMRQYRGGGARRQRLRRHRGR